MEYLSTSLPVIIIIVVVVVIIICYYFPEFGNVHIGGEYIEDRT